MTDRGFRVNIIREARCKMPGDTLISNGIQFVYSWFDARSRKRKLQEEAEYKRALVDRVGAAGGYAAREDLLEDSPTEDIVSGISQVSAKGKGCVSCGNDHFSTAAGILEESLRFAREGGIEHPEVIKRISIAEDELNEFERIDGAAEEVVKLPPDEKELMDAMLKASREMRHMLKEIKDVPRLEKTTADMQKIKREFRGKVFKMSLAKMSPDNQEEIKIRARKVINQAMEGEE